MADCLVPGAAWYTRPALAFPFDVIVVRHLRRARGVPAFLRAGPAAALAVAGMINLVLVLRVLATAWRDRSRWQADGWRACSRDLAWSRSHPSTYAGQGFLIECNKKS